MEIKVKETIEKVVTIELPYYCKSVCYAYKVISDKEVLDVAYNSSTGIGIKIETYVYEGIVNATPITADEFNEIYTEVLIKINKKAPDSGLSCFKEILFFISSIIQIISI